MTATVVMSAQIDLGEQIPAGDHRDAGICSPTRSGPRPPGVSAMTGVLAQTAERASAGPRITIGQRTDPAGLSLQTQAWTKTGKMA